MRKLLLIPIFILCIWVKAAFALSADAQTPIPHITFNTISDIRAQAGIDRALADLAGITSMTDGNGGLYRWDATSVAADDGFITLQVTGVATGRWVRVGNGNTLKGNYNVQGALNLLYYDVTYTGSVTLPYVPSQIYVQATSANGAGPMWISNVTTTGFRINYLTVPALGAITGWYLVIKQ